MAGNIIGVYGNHSIRRCRIKGKTLCGNSQPLVAGDQVICQPTQADEGLILSREKRNTVFQRWDEKHRRLHALAANMTDVYSVIASSIPAYDLEFLAASLVAAALEGLQAHIICTKIDQGQPAILRMYLEYLQSLGYVVFWVSALTGEGMEALQAAIAGKQFLFCGQSGVGKSTLTNALVEKADQQTQEVSQKSHQGRHTTNCAMLYVTSGQGLLIDTPGVRDMSLYGYPIADICHLFPGFSAYAESCHFHRCTHLHEPGCAVLQACEQGKFPHEHYAVYQKIIRRWQTAMQRDARYAPFRS